MNFTPSLLRGAAICALIATPLLASCGEQSSDPMAAARASFEAGKPRIALAQASKAIEAQPGSAEARLLAAEIAMALGNADRAITELKQVSPDAAEAQEASLKLAAAHLSLGNFLPARQILDAADFDSALAYSVAINLEMAEGDYNKAFAQLEDALKKFPVDPQLVTIDANRMFLNAQPQAAAQRLAPVLAAKETVPEAHLLAGQMLLNDRSPIKAKAHFETVLSVKPAQQTAMLALAAIARDAGDTKEATRWINETSKYGSPQPVGVLFAAQMAFDAGEIDRANELLEKFPPELARLAHYQRLSGFVAAARGQRSAAIHSLSDYLAKADGDIPARRVLAEKLAEDRQFDRAWDVLRPAINSPQADGGTLLLALRLAQETGRGNVAAIQQKIAQRDAAASLAKPMLEAGKAIRAGDWARADAIYAPLTQGAGKDDPALLNNAAAVKSKLGQHQEAIALGRRALTLAPTSPQIMDTLGWAIWESGAAPAEARALLTDARKAAPKNREIANHWAIAHAQS